MELMFAFIDIDRCSMSLEKASEPTELLPTYRGPKVVDIVRRDQEAERSVARHYVSHGHFCSAIA